MNLSSTMLLRGVVALMGLAALLLCVWVLPMGLRHEWNTGLAPVLIGMYMAMAPFYIALYQTFRLLNLIDRNKAFSGASVTALRCITYCAAAVAALFTLGLPYFYYVAQAEDAPGVMLIGFVLSGAPLVIAVIAAVLQKLLRSAIALQTEHDLTV